MSRQGKVLSLSVNVSAQTLNPKRLKPVLRLEYKTTWKHTPKGWIGSKTLSSNSERKSTIEWPKCLDFLRNSQPGNSKEINHSQKDQLQTVMEIRTRQTEEPKQTLEDEFKDLHLNLPVLEVLAHVPIYNAILKKYIESLELGKKWVRIYPRRNAKKDRRPQLVHFTL
ncbi:hypothetical protein Tco_0378614 [Tanacetum coccineum]